MRKLLGLLLAVLTLPACSGEGVGPETELCDAPSETLVDCTGSCPNLDARSCNQPAGGFRGNVTRHDVSYVVNAGDELRFAVVWAHCSRFTSSPGSGVTFSAGGSEGACLTVNNGGDTVAIDHVQASPAAADRSWLRVETTVVSSGSCTLECPRPGKGAPQ